MLQRVDLDEVYIFRRLCFGLGSRDSPRACRSILMLRSMLVVLLAFAFYDGAYAEEGIYGCWDNLHEGVAYPENPPSRRMASFGELICFKKDGVVETTHYGGSEALGSGGKFSYKNGHLLLRRSEDTPEGWLFAIEGRDRCSVSIVRGQLTIGQCIGWARSQALILNKRTSQ
jgi:hypothetical protein